jgi:hypothetical protein
MAEIQSLLSPVNAPGVWISWDQSLHVASLRYFDRDALSRSVQGLLGMPLPSVCRAICAPNLPDLDTTILAWRSPTEALLLCGEPALILRLQNLDSRGAGCVVDQTGGLLVLRSKGTRVCELLAGIGGHGSLPDLGQAKCSRIAEVPVLAIQAQLGETLLVVERVYAEHLMNWLRASAADAGDHERCQPESTNNQQ